ncbi:cytochrome b5 reductase 4 [Plakobranchus ocellatus]|uniref:Cytochrome b5 reductase 4 n=1 Tax=Plakobranchus ocellatus TaxID=259542 RepID=A0AAV3YQ77_9GAST|nr:cytochrome b5 reductase 4 [Plakobranchus ocellatus]
MGAGLRRRKANSIERVSKLGCAESKAAANPNRAGGCLNCCTMSGLKVPGTDRNMRESTSELSGRKKVTLAPGHSLMDWIRLGRTKGDLSGVHEKRRDLSLADLALHNTPTDIWMALRGKVYNITPYMDYHPGGADELMRAAGKDGTALFDEIHNWVNVESMLEKCLVGYLSHQESRTTLKEVKPRKPSLANSIQSVPIIPSPTYDWYQTTSDVVVVIYTKWAEMRREFVTVEILPQEVIIQMFVHGFTYFVHFKPSYALDEVPKDAVTMSKDKVEVKLKKVVDQHWPCLGPTLDNDEVYVRTKNLAPKYRKWTVTKNSRVTHNTVLLRLQAPKGFTMVAPLGYHIHVIHNISGMQIGRSYTVMPPSMVDPKSDSEQEEGRAIHLMIKSYPGGTLSPWVTSVKVGEEVMISNFDGNFELKRLHRTTDLIMFAAGSGFTSMACLITYALNDMPNATFPIKLVFYNKTQGDILWRDQLDKLSSRHSRFSVEHILSQEPSNSFWNGLRGRVSSSHIADFVPIPSKDCYPLLCICGPWAYNDAVESLAKLQGLQDEHIHVFSQL